MNATCTRGNVTAIIAACCGRLIFCATISFCLTFACLTASAFTPKFAINTKESSDALVKQELSTQKFVVYAVPELINFVCRDSFALDSAQCLLISNHDSTWELDDIKFKFNTLAFHIGSLKLPRMMKARDTLKFWVYSRFANSDFKQDSISYYEPCIMRSIALVQMVTRSAMKVTDIDFGDVCVDATDTRTFRIENTGSFPITFDSISTTLKNGSYSFSPALDLIDRLMPHESIEIALQLKSTKLGQQKYSIVFHSSTIEKDSVCTVAINGVETSAAVEEEEKQTLRILSAKFAEDGLSFKLKQDGVTDIHWAVYDLAGRCLSQSFINQLDRTYLQHVALPTLDAGCYLLRVSTYDGRSCERMIIKD